jgi:hypothetical protein
MKIKYITFDTGLIEAIIIFPEYVMHRDIDIQGEILGAGFIEVIDGQWNCYGESISLKVKSRPEDSKIANKYIGIK